MTNYQAMIHHLVEKAGECWHDTGGYTNPETGLWHCRKCGDVGFMTDEHPSPTDLNELVRLAEKMGLSFTMLVDIGGRYNADVFDGEDFHTVLNADTPDIALLTALCKATGYKEE